MANGTDDALEWDTDDRDARLASGELLEDPGDPTEVVVTEDD